MQWSNPFLVTGRPLTTPVSLILYPSPSSTNIYVNASILVIIFVPNIISTHKDEIKTLLIYKYIRVCVHNTYHIYKNKKIGENRGIIDGIRHNRLELYRNTICLRTESMVEINHQFTPSPNIVVHIPTTTGVHRRTPKDYTVEPIRLMEV